MEERSNESVMTFPSYRILKIIAFEVMKSLSNRIDIFLLDGEDIQFRLLVLPMIIAALSFITVH